MEKEEEGGGRSVSSCCKRAVEGCKTTTTRITTQHRT
jgi:hypothetical protein